MVKILFVFIFIAFQNTLLAMEYPIEISNLNYISNQVCLDFAQKMEKKGFKLVGIGGGEDRGKIKGLQVSFSLNQVVDLATAREYIIESVLLFLEEINMNKEIKNCLIFYPFTVKNIIVSIDAKCPEGAKQNYVASVSSNFGKIYYYIEDAEGMALVELCEETFEEAQKMLK